MPSAGRLGVIASIGGCCLRGRLRVLKVIAGATMSVDGFVQIAAGSMAALYRGLAERQESPYMAALQAETGAVQGRRILEMAADADGYAFQVPIVLEGDPVLVPRSRPGRRNSKPEQFSPERPPGQARGE